MTESPFPFGATDDATVLEEPAEAGSRRNVLLLGGLAAVLLAGGTFFLLGGDEEVVDDFAAPTRAKRPPAAAAASPKPAKLPVATKVPIGRNPFKALYVAPVAAAAAPVGASTVGASPVAPTSTAPAAARPVVVVAAGPAPAGTAPLPPGTTLVPTGGRAAPAARPAQSTVALKRVSTTSGRPVGTFVYDGRTVTGSKGQVMAGKLKVISLNPLRRGGWYACLKLGDGAPFEVHQHQTVVVQ